MPELERILQNTPGTLSQQWFEAGDPVDPGTVTVEITRADGTVLVAAGTGTTGAGTNPRTFSLTTTHTALLDRLTVTWTSTAKGALTSVLEVVGGFLFSIAQARAIQPLNSTSSYPTETIVAMRTTVEEAIEQACGVAFVPRYTRENLTGSGGYQLLLRPYTTRVRSVTVAGTAWAQPDLDALTYDTVGAVESVYRWPSSRVTVGYEHGYQSVPAEINRAALILAKTWLVGARSPIDDRASTFAAENGVSYSLVVPGRGGSTFGVPEVDAVVGRYSLHAGIA